MDNDESEPSTLARRLVQLEFEFEFVFAAAAAGGGGGGVAMPFSSTEKPSTFESDSD